MFHKDFTFRQTGFGLVEIMVGLVIGLLTTLVIMQIFSAFEGQKRSTTGSADAQTSGSIALFSITRDMQMAGYGLIPSTNSPLDCDPSPATPAGVNLTPVVIVDGGNAAGASDTVAIRYGTSPTGGVPTEIGALSPAPGTTVTMTTNLGCNVGDLALITNGASCQIKTVTALTTPPDNTGVILNNLGGVLVGAQLSCLGSWTQSIYQAVNGNLEINGVSRVSGIVNLQAQYGISASADSNQVISWVDAVNNAAGNWAAPSVAERNRIKAIRIAVVARNEQFEKEDVSAACSSTTAASPSGVCSWAGSVGSPAPAVDLSNIDSWQRYRYRVFETIVPLRNVIWSRDKL